MTATVDPEAAAAQGRATLRIAALHGAGRARGVELVRLLVALDARGHAVRLYHDDPEIRDAARGADLLARAAPLGGILGVHRAWRFARELRRRGPGVVLLDDPSTWLGAMGAGLARVPAVARIRARAEVPRSPFLRAAFLRWVRGVVVDADALADELRAALPDFQGRLVTIRPGVVPPAPRGAATFRAMLGIPLDAPVVGTVAPGRRLQHRDDGDPLIRVLSAAPAAHGVIVGDGPARRAIQRRAESAGVGPRLHFTGELPDPGPALDAMELFVRPTSAAATEPELLEAMAAGVPVVGTHVPGLEETLAAPAGVGRPAAGRVAESDDDLAAQAAELLAHRGTLRVMGEAARDVTRSRFEIERAVIEWETFLAELAEARHGGR